MVKNPPKKRKKPSPKKRKKKANTISARAVRTGQSLETFNPDQWKILTALLLFPTDTAARAHLKWSNDRFYRLKKTVIKHVEEYAKQLHKDTHFSMSLAGRSAVSKLIQQLEKGGQAFQKEVADDILDRFGLGKDAGKPTGDTPPGQNKLDQYFMKDD